MDADIEKLVVDAQNDAQKLNKLIEQFLPFIKKCVSNSRIGRQSQDDALTIAMLVFADCVKSYSLGRGSFMSFVQVSIRNRLIDDFRANQKFVNHNVPLLEKNTGNDNWETRLSVEEHRRQLERTSLRLEIEELSDILALWNTSFDELSRICPKQKRTRAKCEYIAALVLKNQTWRKQLLNKHRLPSKEMCDVYGVSIKILEKYRKYIAVLCVIQSGDYPMLRAFLPVNRKGGMDYE